MPNRLSSHQSRFPLIRCFLFVILGLSIVLFLIPIPASATSSTLVSRGEPFQISVTLLTNTTDGELLSNQVVEFYDETYDTFLGEAVTNELGIATLDYAFPLTHPKGYTLVNATFRGNESQSLAPSYQWILFLVTSLTSMELNYSSTLLAPNDDLIISVSLTDDLENPLPNEKISIYCDGTLLTTSRTNISGYALVDINLENASIGVGHHSILVVYEGNSTSFDRGVSNTFDFEVRKITTSINPLEPINESLELNQTIGVDVEVISNEGPLSDVPLSILIDGTVIGKSSTDSIGRAYFTIWLNESYSLGFHILEIQYSGDIRHDSSALQVEVKIITDLLLGITHDPIATINSTIGIDLEVLDILARPLPHVFVTLSDTTANRTVFFEYVYQSEITLEFAITGTLGMHKFYLTAESGFAKSNDTETFLIEVWIMPSFRIISSNIFGYATPEQTIQLTARLSDNLGNLSHKSVTALFSWNADNLYMTSDQFGIIRLTITSPALLGIHSILLNFNGSPSDFEFPSTYQYFFNVSTSIPVRITDFVFDIDYITRSISLRLQIYILNVTPLSRVPVEIRWHISPPISIMPSPEGRLFLSLSLPLNPGLYEFGCHIPTGKGIGAHSETLYIVINPTDSNVSEGIGFYPLALGILGSFLLPVLPKIRKKSITR